MKLVPQQPGAREIKVKLMLSGGHAAMLVLPLEHPLLGQLFQTIAASAGGGATPPSTLFQIPVEGGRASLAFASHQLIGVVTDPALLLRSETESTPASPQIIRHPLVQLDNFLSVDELRSLRDTVISSQSGFQSSRTSEVTASVDGSYFRAHTDQGKSAIDATRQLTYVYYFNREPKGFTGGELRVYDDELRNGKYSSTDTFQVVEPRNNSIVFFNAAIMHEVMQVHVPSQEFADSRFTVNGWVHRT